MSHLRHASRHIHHTVAQYIQECLDELGWTSSDEVDRPFGATQVTVHRTGGVGKKGLELKAGQVFVTPGDEGGPERLEMGGPLSQQDLPIFIDVLMDEDALAVCLAADIRDALLGRFEFAARGIPVVDQATGTAVPGWHITFEDVARIRPDQLYALDWQVVKVTAQVQFQEVY